MKKLIFFIALLLPGILLAHPGHGVDDGWSILHYTVSIEHAIPLILVLMIGVVLFIRFRIIKKVYKDI